MIWVVAILYERGRNMMLWIIFLLLAQVFHNQGGIHLTLDETVTFQIPEAGWDIERAINFANDVIFAISNMQPEWLTFFCPSETTDANAKNILGTELGKKNGTI